MWQLIGYANPSLEQAYFYIWEGGVTDINMKFLAAESLKIQRAVLFSKDGLTYHNRWSWIFTFEIFDNK